MITTDLISIKIIIILICVWNICGDAASTIPAPSSSLPSPETIGSSPGDIFNKLVKD